MNIADWSDENLRRFGDYDAVVVGDRVWTSAELHDGSCRLASALLDLGLEPGDRVVLALPNSADLMMAFTAVLRSGGVAVPVFPNLPAGDITRIVRLATPAAIVAGTHLLRTADAPSNDVPIRIAGGDADLDGWLSLDNLVRRHHPLSASVAREAADLAVICYTSGTSGAPKGVIHTQGSVHARHGGGVRRASARFLMALPLNTIGAAMLTGRLAHQWTIILLDTFEPRPFLAAIERHRVTKLVLVPSMGEALAALPDLGTYDLSSLGDVFMTGADVAPSLLEKLSAVMPITPSVNYGMTETGGGIASSGFGSKPGSVGRVLKGVDVRIVDEHGDERPCGSVGEIYVRTPWMGAGYFGQPEETAAAFADGWVRTGDLGYLDEDRELFIVGRRKDLINQSGVKVAPREVVEVLRCLPGIEECAVVGVPHALVGEQVVACIVSRADARVSADEVLAHCRSLLDPRKVPVRVWFCDALPKTPNGKIRVEALRERLASAHATIVETELVRRLRSAPVSERIPLMQGVVHEQLCRIAPRYGADPPGVDSTVTFGESGLDSLGIARAAHVIGDALGRPVAPTLFFSHPTIHALCRHLVDEVVGVSSTAVHRRSRPVAAREPIAIIGCGCRLPGGADTPDRFWSMLQRGVDATADISRWDVDALYDPARGAPGSLYTRRAALLDTFDMFDAEFFGVSPREARSLDPQHRLVLEVTWEALEHAACDPTALSDSLAGLFLGINGSSSAGGTGLGGEPAMAVGRVCHFLDLRGPAAAIDTACSSSLVAVHTAVQALRLGECDIAVAGGVQVIGSLRSFVGLCEMNLMAADGRCKTFDASADGFGRGEGCVMIVLKRLSDAQANRDRIIAVIRGTAARHDGRSSSLTAPNGRAQQDVIRAALEDAGVAPADVDYLEAHGTGTALGDPTELEAAMAVFAPRRRPLAVGSVKTNIGHLESAAGVAGLLKVALALEHHEIPSHLHCHTLNPLLEPLSSTFVIPATTQPWPEAHGRRRLAGVTSMGLSGTNVHVVVEEAPPAADCAAQEPRPHLLCLSARTEAALHQQAQRYAENLGALPPEAFADFCFTATAGRARFSRRLAVVARTPSSARDELLAATRATSRATRTGTAASRPKVAFMFTGIGSQYAGMGRQLYESAPAFRRALERCADILRPMLRRPLIDAIYSDADNGPDTLRLAHMELGQPALFAFEWSLCELWKSWGIEPDVVIGHSIGECVAACVAGLMTVEEGLKLAAARGRLMQSLSPSGAMMACAIDRERVRLAIGSRAGEVSIAAINGPRRTVISGGHRAVIEVARTLNADGVATRALGIPCACHSPLIDPILDEFERVASDITYSPLRVGLISTLTGKPATFEELAQPNYWRRHMREPVEFAAGAASLAARECDVVIEVGPQAVLVGMAPDCVADAPRGSVWLTSLRKDRDDRQQLLETVADLYVRGCELDWRGFHAGGEFRRLTLPTYPFQRTRHGRRTTGAGTRTDVVPERPSPAPVAVTSEPSVEALMDSIRRHVAESVGRAPESVSLNENCVDLGIDSLGVLDVVNAVRHTTGIVCTPADFIARPTVADFAAHVSRRMTAGRSASARPPARSPLAVLNDGGSRAPLFCMHPSGGQITAYLRLRARLGAGQPIYALQSRAPHSPEHEHPTITSMAIDYATVVQSVRPDGPYRLVGWSMGGVIAHAVGCELERRGARVALVGLIDVIVPRAGTRPSAEDELAFALKALVADVQPSQSASGMTALDLDAAPSSGRADLLTWCEAHGSIPAGLFTSETFDAALRLYQRHFELLRDHRPGVVDAPIVEWRASSPRRPHDWSEHTRAGVTAKVVGGNHFTVMQPPQIDVIAADLESFQAHGALTAVSLS